MQYTVPADSAEDLASKDRGRACAQEEPMARREAQRHACAHECRVLMRWWSSIWGRGWIMAKACCLEEMMCELGLTERVSVDNNNSVLVVIVVSA